MRSRVDFPTPGLPPISVSEPGTTPPPSTPSSSLSKDEYLYTSFSTISLILTAFEAFEVLDLVCFTTSCCCWFSSINESQDPQFVHLPIHLGVVNPQC